MVEGGSWSGGTGWIQKKVVKEEYDQNIMLHVQDIQ